MYTIILAGGSGTRLFPLSRSSYPKQFIPLLENESLFQKAVKRALLFSNPEEIYIVTNDTHKFLVEDQLKTLDVACHILTEPCGKNTLPAIFYAALEISKTDAHAIIMTLASDQLIKVDDAYKKSVSAAVELAKTNLVTFGVVPVCAHTGYGYIKPGEKIGEGFAVSSFVEKPDVKTAEKYVAEGYLWNSGMFSFSAQTFINETKKYAPEVVSAFSHPASEAYELTPKISIDYGVMEKTDKAAVVPLSSSWNDLGNFEALYQEYLKDLSGNAVKGEYITPDGTSNLILSDKLVSTIGLSNIAVIDTADALLVCPLNQSQKVGEIAKLLMEREDERASLHTTVHRPWGHYTILLKGDRFQMKRITVNPEKRISLQYHHHRSEHWVVVSGTAEVVNGDNKFFVRTGESTFVPAGQIHRLSNPGLIPLEVIEVQIGEYLSEDDIVRVEDDYERE